MARNSLERLLTECRFNEGFDEYKGRATKAAGEKFNKTGIHSEVAKHLKNFEFAIRKHENISSYSNTPPDHILNAYEEVEKHRKTLHSAIIKHHGGM